MTNRLTPRPHVLLVAAGILSSLAGAIHWEKDRRTYWIQWTLKDDAAVLWAYDPQDGKAVEILQVRDK